MRMWMLDPKILCNKHLLGEHGEIHKHKHNFEKKHRMTGRIYPIALIEPLSMQERHDALSIEMLKRGMKHESPYNKPDISYLPEDQQNAKVNIDISLKDLKLRCVECAKRIQGGQNEKLYNSN